MIDPVAIIGTHLPRAASPLFPDLLWRIPTREKRAYLTFDDGPTATMTALLAGILESFGARASFFLVGSHAEHHPDLARSLLDGGHEIGGHTYSHPDAWRASRANLLEELERSTRLLEDITGRPLRWMRPPYGHFTPAMIRWCAEHGQKVVMWDLAPGDYLERISQADVERHIQAYIRPGSVIVLHDNPRAAETTPRALERILESLTAEGWSFEPLPHPDSEHHRTADPL